MARAKSVGEQIVAWNPVTGQPVVRKVHERRTHKTENGYFFEYFPEHATDEPGVLHEEFAQGIVDAAVTAQDTTDAAAQRTCREAFYELVDTYGLESITTPGGVTLRYSVNLRACSFRPGKKEEATAWLRDNRPKLLSNKGQLDRKQVKKLGYAHGLPADLFVVDFQRNLELSFRE